MGLTGTEYVGDGESSVLFVVEVSYFNPGQDPPHEDDAQRQIASTLYVRYHYFTENMIAEKLTPARLKPSSPLAKP